MPGGPQMKTGRTGATFNKNPESSDGVSDLAACNEKYPGLWEKR